MEIENKKRKTKDMIWVILRIVAICFLIYSFATADELVLRKKVAISQRYINLIDLVQAAPETLMAFPDLKKVYLGKSPAEGGLRIITAKEIENELQWHGLDKLLTITGEEVKVTRIKSEELYVSQMLKDAILDYISKCRQMSAESLEVEISYFNSDDFKRCIIINSVEKIDDNLAGAIRFAINFMTPEHEKASEVIADVAVRQPVCVARHSIMRGAVLKDGDIEVKNVALKSDQTYFADTHELAGAIVLKDIGTGAFITPESVNITRLKAEQPLLVRAYTQVRAKGRYSVVDARALMDGHLGELIPIEILSTKFQTKAKVLSKDMVEIVSEEKK